MSPGDRCHDNRARGPGPGKSYDKMKSEQAPNTTLGISEVVVGSVVTISVVGLTALRRGKRRTEFQ